MQNKKRIFFSLDILKYSVTKKPVLQFFKFI